MRKKPCVKLAWSPWGAESTFISFHSLPRWLSQHNESHLWCITSQSHVPVSRLLFGLCFLQSDCEWSSSRAASRQNSSDIQHRRNLTRLRGGSSELKARRVKSPNEEGISPSSGNKIERKWYLSELLISCSREVGESPLFYIRRLGCRDDFNIWNSHRFQKNSNKSVDLKDPNYWSLWGVPIEVGVPLEISAPSILQKKSFEVNRFRPAM